MPGLISEVHAPVKRKRSDQPLPSKSSKKRRPSSEDAADDVQLLEDQIVASQKHYNNIVTLINIARKDLGSEFKESQASLALCRVFCRLHASGRMRLAKSASTNEAKIVEWLDSRQADYLHILSELIRFANGYKRGFALSLELLQAEVLSKGDRAWRTGVFDNLVTTVRSLSSDHPAVEEFRKQYFQTHRDILYYTLEHIGQSNGLEISSRAVDIVLLSILNPNDKAHEGGLFCKPPDGGLKKITQSLINKQVQAAWLAVLGSKLEDHQKKQVLGIISKRVVPWFQNVEVLMDFLTDSYNTGGATSLLALSGLFALMQEKNLDYPDFYTKLYTLLDSKLLHSKHRSRFFRLLDVFMASTHLPAALVASFIKRLSRLALHAPPAGIVAVIPWVYNMLKAHPTCTFMIHRVVRTDEEQAFVDQHGFQDPFDMSKGDPMETQAIESSLWELETLQSHYHPNVASLARIMSEQFTKKAYNLEDFLDHSYNTLIDSELGKELKKTPVSEFEIPKKVFVGANGASSLEELLSQVLDQQSRNDT